MADVTNHKATADAPPKAAKLTSRNAVALHALKVLRRMVEGDVFAGDDAEAEIEALCEHFGLPRQVEVESDDDRETGIDEFIVGEMEEALARARRGQILDCIIHLGRALPEQYSGIADALERKLERGR